MPYQLSDDELLIKNMVRDFAQAQGLEAASDRDRFDTYPEVPMQEAAGLGLTGMGLSAEEGGAGVSGGAYALALYEIARIDPSFAAILASHNGMALRLLSNHAVAPQLVAGEPAAYLATEEAGGSDKSRLTTLATATDDGFTLTGRKAWGLGAAGAKHFVVLAHVEEHGASLFYVSRDATGITLGQNEALMGLRGAGIRTVYFDDVALPSDALIGELGSGMTQYKAALPWLQVGIAAAILGGVAGGFDAAMRFAETRVQFGEPIGKFQAVSDGVTNIDLQLAAGRALLLEAAASVEAGADAAAQAARVKAFAAEMSIPMTRQAIRIQGGTGFMREGGTERFARDVRALWFVGETPHMQRDVLKRHLLDVEFEAEP
jgi:alkylation response protein AidB-like acyl-CoA dehydrogenase